MRRSRASDYAQLHDAQHRLAQPAIGEDHSTRPSPNPGHSVSEMAAQLAADPEFEAWYWAEVRGMVGRR